MNASIRRTLALATLGLAGVAATSTAQAGVSWHIGINLPGPQVYYPPPVVYYEPPPVVYRPAPRVVYHPPVYYRPAPVIVHQHAPRGHWRDGRWHDRKGKRHDHDRDDRRNHRHQGHYRY